MAFATSRLHVILIYSLCFLFVVQGVHFISASTPATSCHDSLSWWAYTNGTVNQTKLFFSIYYLECFIWSNRKVVNMGNIKKWGRKFVRAEGSYTHKFSTIRLPKQDLNNFSTNWNLNCANVDDVIKIGEILRASPIDEEIHTIKTYWERKN